MQNPMILIIYKLSLLPRRVIRPQFAILLLENNIYENCQNNTQYDAYHDRLPPIEFNHKHMILIIFCPHLIMM